MKPRESTASPENSIGLRRVGLDRRTGVAGGMLILVGHRGVMVGAIQHPGEFLLTGSRMRCSVYAWKRN
jgi:hypothetical protein